MSGIGFTYFQSKRRKGQPEERPVTDDEVAKAEAELDALYLKEHGELPEKPTHGKDENA